MTTKLSLFQQKLQKLPPMSDFMITEIASDPAASEALCCLLARRVMHIDVGHIHVTTQKPVTAGLPGLHAIRLDIHIDQIEAVKMQENLKRLEVTSAPIDLLPDIMNIEAETRSADKRELPKRSRYYHALMDARSLEAGKDYEELPNTAIFWISSFDPFNQNRMVYTIKNGCLEDAAIPYEDGAVTFFLYTGGKQGNPAEDLRSLLRYLEKGELENRDDPELEKLDSCIRKIKQKQEVGTRYMDVWLHEKRMREDAMREGQKKGRKEAREEGILSFVRICRKYHATKEETVDNLKEQYGLESEEAGAYIKRYWET